MVKMARISTILQAEMLKRIQNGGIYHKYFCFLASLCERLRLLPCYRLKFNFCRSQKSKFQQSRFHQADKAKGKFGSSNGHKKKGSPFYELQINSNFVS